MRSKKQEAGSKKEKMIAFSPPSLLNLQPVTCNLQPAEGGFYG